MSYILDALRRSERERLERQAPSLHSVAADSGEPPRRWGMVAIVLGLLANLILAAYWVFFMM